MSALRSMCCAAAVLLLAALTVGPATADNRPWFAAQVGNATQVISVVGVGGSEAKMDVWQRGAAGWQPVAAAIPAQIGSAGMSPNIYEGSMMTPMGVFTLNSASSPLIKLRDAGFTSTLKLGTRYSSTPNDLDRRRSVFFCSSST